MTFVSGFFGFVIGLPVGVLLYVTPGANYGEHRAVSLPLCGSQYFPLSIPFICPAGVDDSFYE